MNILPVFGNINKGKIFISPWIPLRKIGSILVQVAGNYK